jgi:hypothetical protein
MAAYANMTPPQPALFGPFLPSQAKPCPTQQQHPEDSEMGTETMEGRLVFLNAFDGKTSHPAQKPPGMSDEDFARVARSFSDGRGFDVSGLALEIIRYHDHPDCFLVLSEDS